MERVALKTGEAEPIDISTEAAAGIATPAAAPKIASAPESTTTYLTRLARRWFALNRGKLRAMRRFCILDHGNHYQTILAIEADDGRPRLLMPFAGQSSIAKAAMVGDDRIFCLAQDGACCLLDWRSGRELASGRTCNPHANVFITRDARFVVLY